MNICTNSMYIFQPSIDFCITNHIFTLYIFTDVNLHFLEEGGLWVGVDTSIALPERRAGMEEVETQVRVISFY